MMISAPQRDLNPGGERGVEFFSQPPTDHVPSYFANYVFFLVVLASH